MADQTWREKDELDWSCADCVDHLRECPGCHTCDSLLEDFMACDRCGHWGLKDSHGWTMVGQRILCDGCADIEAHEGEED